MPRQSTTTTTTTIQPRLRTVQDAMVYSGLGRKKIYEEAARHPGLLVKAGVRTLVNMPMLDQILDELPVADIKVPSAIKEADERIERNRLKTTKATAERQARAEQRRKVKAEQSAAAE
jgi:hypothetical protein